MVDLWVFLMLFLDSSPNKTSLGEFLELEHFLNRKYFKKSKFKMTDFCCETRFTLNLKKCITQEPLEVRLSNFQDFLLFMKSITGKNFKKVCEVRVSWSG